MVTAQPIAVKFAKQNETKNKPEQSRHIKSVLSPPVHRFQLRCFLLPPDRAMSVLSILILMCLGPTNPTRTARLLEVIYEWKDMEFAFPSPSARHVLMKTRAYIPGNSYPIDADAWLQGKCVKSLSKRNHSHQ